MKFSVTQNGVELDPSKYIWDKETKTFFTTESNLVLDFSNIDGCTFKTGYGCTFKTGSGCAFNTGSYCTFNTGYSCTFKTGAYCTLDAGSYCTFNTGPDCTFNIGNSCTIRTYYNSIIEIKENCVVHRADTNEVWMLSNVKIQTKEENTPGYYTEEEMICRDVIE